jgi:hypothetical protein
MMSCISGSRFAPPYWVVVRNSTYAGVGNGKYGGCFHQPRGANRMACRMAVNHNQGRTSNAAINLASVETFIMMLRSD